VIILKNHREIGAIREAGSIVAGVFKAIESLLTVGTPTRELDATAEEWIRKHKAVPAFKGYHGFPATLCVSINEEVVHGIPGARRLQAGDVVSIDVGVNFRGWFADAARTYALGDISEPAKRQIRTTREALDLAIAAAQPGGHLSDIGHAVQRHVEKAGFQVVRDFVGHGIGRELHEDPHVPNFGEPHRGVLLKPGMVLAIEPMVNAGTFEVDVLADLWTVVSRDRSLSTHFEHTIAITETGAEVLTQ
jgi:methionyl aminopeptidase